MRRFIFGFFAVVGFLSILSMAALGGLAYWGFTKFRAEQPVFDESVILTADLRGAIENSYGADPFAFLDFDGKPTVIEVVEALDAAKDDPRVLGFMAIMDGGQHGPAVTQEIRQAVERFKSSGKPTLAFADSFGELTPGNMGYYLASSFDEIHLQPVGFVGLTGLAFELPFAAEALAKIGVDIDVTKRAEYKSALEFVSEDQPSQANAEMMQALLDDLQDQMVVDIATGRGLDADDLSRLIGDAPFSANEAQNSNLIDAVSYHDQAMDAMEDQAGGHDSWMSIGDYHEARATDEREDGAVIGLVVASGPIVRGESEFGEEIAADTISRAIAEAADDPEVQAIILRIDSPGGSAVASETIAREVSRARESGVPVIISMSNTAASGGYWVSMRSDRIVAEPATLTGSIGVIAAKPVLSELWEKLGVNWAMFAESDHASMWSANSAFTDSEKARVEALVDGMYQEFVAGVAAGRSLSEDDVEEIARGRVWTGKQALDIGLVDELGGLFEAKQAARDLSGLEPNAAIDLKRFPEPLDPFSRALAVLEGEFGRLGFARAIARIWNELPVAALPGTVKADVPRVQ